MVRDFAKIMHQCGSCILKIDISRLGYHNSLMFLCVAWILSSHLTAQDLEVHNPLKTATGSIATDSGDSPPEQKLSPVSSLQGTDSGQLGYFGYQFFQRPSPSENAWQYTGLPKDYRLGPGDRLMIFLGGKAQQQFEVQVSVDGKIFIPTVGIFQVHGISLQTFRNELNNRLSKYYSDYELELLMQTPKQIRVRVMGEVTAPGDYTVNALSSPLDILLLAQGPLPNGSLRNIQIVRDEELVQRVDLYEYLVRPKKVAPVLLQSGDQIFVPLVQGWVHLSGQVRRPAIYEVLPKFSETVSEMISWAGELNDLALVQRIELSRLKQNGTRRLYNISIHDSLFETLEIQNHDRLHVYSRLDLKTRQEVNISGEIKKPGSYTLAENMRVLDLIYQAGYLKRTAYLQEAKVARIDPQKDVHVITIDLQQILDDPAHQENLFLQEDDHVFIRQIPQWYIGPMVDVQGQVLFPGKYAINRDSTYLSDIILRAGGLTPDALVSEAKLVRSMTSLVEDKEFERLKEMSPEQMSEQEYEYFVMKQNSSDLHTIVVDFYRLLIQGDRSEDVILRDGDRIVVPHKTNLVMVSGRVARSGGVVYKANTDLSYYIEKAGGFAWDADKSKTKVIKANGEIVDDEDINILQPGDRIWVPRRDRDLWQTFQDVMTTLSQIATIYLVIRTARND
ncbi:hypothetical protein GF406_01905 [candidate division KSB1 bacterium]|nr:hypothetical protein [candidate division KSB1 bacterium]